MFNCSQLQIMQNVLRMFVSVRILLEIHRNFTSCAIHFATTRMEDILDSLLFCVLFIVAVAGTLKKKKIQLHFHWNYHLFPPLLICITLGHSTATFFCCRLVAPMSESLCVFGEWNALWFTLSLQFVRVSIEHISTKAAPSCLGFAVRLQRFVVTLTGWWSLSAVVSQSLSAQSPEADFTISYDFGCTVFFVGAARMHCRPAAHRIASGVLSCQRWAQHFQYPSKSLISGIAHSSKCLLPKLVGIRVWNEECRFPLTLGYGKLHCRWCQIFLCCLFQTPMSQWLCCRGDVDAAMASFTGRGRSLQ